MEEGCRVAEPAADSDPPCCVDVFSGSLSAGAAPADGVHEKVELRL